MKLFDPDKYNFTDSIITKIEYDADSDELLVLIDCFQGKDDSIELRLKLKGIKELTIHKNSIGVTDDKWSALSVSNISKTVAGENIHIVIEPIISFIPGHENDAPILNCVCEKAFAE